MSDVISHTAGAMDMRIPTDIATSRDLAAWLAHDGEPWFAETAPLLYRAANWINGSVFNNGVPSMTHVWDALQIREPSDHEPSVWVFNQEWEDNVRPCCAGGRLEGLPVIYRRDMPSTEFYLVSTDLEHTVVVANIDDYHVHRGSVGTTLASPFEPVRREPFPLVDGGGLGIITLPDGTTRVTEARGHLDDINEHDGWKLGISNAPRGVVLALLSDTGQLSVTAEEFALLVEVASSPGYDGADHPGVMVREVDGARYAVLSKPGVVVSVVVREGDRVDVAWNLRP